MLLQWLLSALWILFNILIELVPTSLHGSLTSSYTRAGNLLVPLPRSSFLPLHLLVLCMEYSTPPSPGQFLLFCSHVTSSPTLTSSSPPPPPVTLFDLFVFFTTVFLKLSFSLLNSLAVERRRYQIYDLDSLIHCYCNASSIKDA